MSPPERHPPSLDEVAPRVYEELRRLAAAYIRHEHPGQTLQPTALVHEAYLRLVGAGTPWTDHRHFVGIAARSMRQILVDHARAHGYAKRGGDRQKEPLDETAIVSPAKSAEMLALDEAMKARTLKRRRGEV